MKKIKLGFIGSGYMGQLAHLQNYVQLEDCEVVAIADAKVGQAEHVARMYGIEDVYADYSKLLSRGDITAIVAAQPYTNHVNIVPDVLEAGKHILTEKPLTLYAENAEPLVKQAQESGLIHMIGYHKRSDPASELAKKYVLEASDGRWGALRYIRITMPPGDWIGGSKQPVSSNEKYPPFIPEKRPAGISDEFHKKYDVFVNYYIHQVNLMRYFFGEDYKVVFADKKEVLLVAESASGLTGVIEMAPYQTSDDWQEKITVCYENAYIEVSLPAPLASQQAGKLTVFTDIAEQGGRFLTHRLPNTHAMKNQAANFIKALKGEAEPPCRSSEALKDLNTAFEYIAMTLKG